MADNLSVYFPDEKKALRTQLGELAKKQDRSVNYLVLKAIMEHLEREERKG